MKKAIKYLESRIQALNTEIDKRKTDFDNCEMTSDVMFIQSDIENLELDKLEFQEAIRILNNNVK